MYEELIKNLRHDSASALQNCEFDFVQGWMVEAADAIEDLENRLNLHRQGKIRYWIPVTERLPDYDKVVQITDGIEVGHGYLEGVNTTVGIALLWHSPFCDIDEEHITHWMPLPEPPKEEK